MILRVLSIFSCVLSVPAAGQSVWEAATAAVDSNLTGKTMNIYTTLNHAAAKYIRNTNCWAASFDLSCVAVFNSFGMSLSTNGCCPWESPTRRAGTLISPRHLIYAHHYEIPPGTTLRFVTRFNTVVTSRLVNSARVGDTDLQVGVLEANLPAHLIGFAKILPADFAKFFPPSWAGLPALCLNQNEEALVTDVAALSPSPTNATYISFQIPTDPLRRQFYKDKISGDSSQPAFLILNGQLVILTVWTGGGPGSGFFIDGFTTQINAVMKQLGGGQQLTPVDLRRFPRYNPPRQ
jgi:hypothetical protein